MVKPMFMALVAGLGSVLLAGCTTKQQPAGCCGAPEEAESSKAASPQRVTLFVEGMTKVQGIT